MNYLVVTEIRMVVTSGVLTGEGHMKNLANHLIHVHFTCFNSTEID